MSDEHLAAQWAADNGLGTTQATVEHNLGPFRLEAIKEQPLISDQSRDCGRHMDPLDWLNKTQASIMHSRHPDRGGNDWCIREEGKFDTFRGRTGREAVIFSERAGE